MSEWVKIADREPKPNTNVLLWRSGWQARTGYKGAVSGGYILWGFVRPIEPQPTHWMPLPEAPVLPEPPPPTPLTWARVDRVEPESFESVLLWNEGWGRTLLGHRTLSSEYVDIESEPFDPGPTHWMWFPNKGPGADE